MRRKPTKQKRKSNQCFVKNNHKTRIRKELQNMKAGFANVRTSSINKTKSLHLHNEAAAGCILGSMVCSWMATSPNPSVEAQWCMNVQIGIGCFSWTTKSMSDDTFHATPLISRLPPRTILYSNDPVLKPNNSEPLNVTSASVSFPIQIFRCLSTIRLGRGPLPAKLANLSNTWNLNHAAFYSTRFRKKYFFLKNFP